MKTTKLISVIVLVLAFIYAFTGCSKKNDEMKDKKQVTEQKHEEHSGTDTTKMVKDGAYFCTMHPLEQSNEPGRCPICKMDLASKKDFNKKMMDKHEELEGKYAGKPDAMHFEIKTSTLKSWECENAIKKAVKNAPGVLDFYSDILDSRIHLYIDKSKTSKKDVEKVIADLGYDANDMKANADALAKLPSECK